MNGNSFQDRENVIFDQDRIGRKQHWESWYRCQDLKIWRIGRFEDLVEKVRIGELVELRIGPMVKLRIGTNVELALIGRIGIIQENWCYVSRRIGIDGSLAALNNLRKLRSKEIMQLRNQILMEKNIAKLRISSFTRDQKVFQDQIQKKKDSDP